MNSVMTRRGKYLFLCTFLFSFGSNVDAQRGTSCRTPNDEWARCTSIYDCNRLLRVVQTKDPDQLNFLRESQCGYDSVPLVCCGSVTSYNRNNNNNNNRRFSRNPALPRRNACGYQETDRIYHGNDTQLDEYPWMALLQYRNDTGHTKWACGGTLINRRYVLTAAHCVTGLSKKAGDLINVRLGEFDIDSRIDCVGERNCNDPPVDIPVESFSFYSSYKPSDHNRYHDIGLVRLSREVQYSNYIRPICLPEPEEVAREGANAIVAGWGATENAGRSSKKQKLQVPISQWSQCATTFASAGVQLRRTQICAGGEDGKDSCRGDSGGPLMVTSRNDTSQWYLEGIVSFGAACGSKGWPGIYTKVESYLEWIHGNVKG